MPNLTKQKTKIKRKRNRSCDLHPIWLWWQAKMIKSLRRNDFVKVRRLNSRTKFFFFILLNFPLETMKKKTLNKKLTICAAAIWNKKAYKITWYTVLVVLFLLFCLLWLIKFMLFGKIQLFYWDNVGDGFSSFFLLFIRCLDFVCMVGAVMQVARVQ